MKKAIKIIVLLLLVAFAALQFIRVDTAPRPVVDAETLEATVFVPPDVEQIFARACNDCHTNNTRYPWYAQTQPAAWFMQGHIDDGRRNMNFSIFKTYSVKKQLDRLEGICERVQSREMPLPSYLWLHGDAVLTDSDVKALCAWSDQEKAKIAAE